MKLQVFTKRVYLNKFVASKYAAQGTDLLQQDDQPD